MKNPSTAVFLAAMAFFALATGSVSGAEAAAPVSGTTNASATSANGGASQVRDIDNEYFRVTKNGYSGPKAEEGIGSRVIVALNDVVIQVRQCSGIHGASWGPFCVLACLPVCPGWLAGRGWGA